MLQADQEGDACTQLLSLSIEKALKLKGNTGSKRQHVHGCSLVRARKFYGYHSLEELFAKIYLYHPHDVARAASLLLGGEVLDRSLQPHESHIPFLLQFLIDYNLYGMGHIHVSKIKFRHPVPSSAWRKDSYNRHGSGKDIPTCTSAGLQADPSEDAALCSQIWMSSTIPDGWMWECPSQLDSSSCQDVRLVKRQSTCELEGDATVDEILNQQFKMYSSLSQTRSDVKMVQSLIPIWEEEYERTGRHEVALLSDPGKPLPGDVLRTLSLGLELENKLMELCNEAENDSYCTPLEKVARYAEPMRPTDEQNMVESGLCDPRKDDGQALKFLKVGNETIILPQGSPWDDDGVIIAGEGKAACPKQLLVDDVQLSRTNGSSDVKVGDKEAMGLLSWLASSQAAEDINSDDELAREIILSPLVPATTIDKVLEKANMDFESESQQECQDILDSVNDSFPSDILKECASSMDHNYLNQYLSEKVIPQVDGSPDDQNSIPNDGKSAKFGMYNEIDRFPEDNMHKETGSSSTSKNKKGKPLWGSLPFSLTQMVNEDLESRNRNCIETKEAKVTSSRAGNETDRDFYDLKEESTLIGCSVRDLMRRKRYYRFEASETESQRIKMASMEEAHNYPKQLEVHAMQNNWEDMRLEEFAKCEPSLTHEINRDQDVIPCSTTLALNSCGKACDVRHAYSNYSFHSKQSLSSTNDSSLPANTSKDGGFCSLEGLIDDITTQASGRPEYFTNSVPRKSLKFLNSPNQNSEISFGHCENDNIGEPEVDDSKEPVTSEVYIGEPDSCVQMRSLDTDEKLLVIERFHIRDSTGASCWSASPVRSQILGIDDCSYKNGREGKTLRQNISEMSSANAGGMEATTGSTILRLENYCGVQHGKDTDLPGPVRSVSSPINFGANSKGLIGMTFNKKPPVVDWTIGTFENPSASLDIPQHASLEEGGGYGGISVHRKLVDAFLPFFEDDCLKDGAVQKTSSGDNGLDHHHNRVMGVPAHYQNDGSYLYMLTPVFSPPSVDSVSRWLLHDDSGKNPNAASEESSSPKCSQISSQGSLIDSTQKPLSEFGSVSGVKPSILGQLKQAASGDLKAEMSPFGEGVTAEYQSECNIMKGKECSDCLQDISQISGPDGKSKPTPLSQIGFRDPASLGGGQQLTLLSIEVHAESRGELRPDPRSDAINAIVLAFQEDNDNSLDIYVLLRSNTEYDRNLDGIVGCKMLASSEEKHLFSHFMNIICSIDPDIIMGWDIQGSSLGYLAERALHLGIRLLNGLSRTPTETKVAFRESGVSERGILENVLPEPLVSDSIQLEDAIIEDEWGRTHSSGVHVSGRVVLNLWRLMRGELKLNMYTVEAVAEAVLRRKIPFIPSKVLTRWFSSGPGQARYRCIEYAVERAKLNLEIMNQLDMVNRTSELARVFGIDFFSVLSRGSQYRVESMLLRLAHTQNYVAISPGSQQVASQPAMECLPLVMEPESGFYADPVVVLDFQSLYPSMIIAYNLCFCTCLGNVMPSKANTLGVSSFSPDLHILRELKHDILLTPNGVMYVPSKVRKGILPRLLEEILSTRILVKQAMKKLTPSQQVLQRIFNARQLALKLIANVTYGYTAAGYSGRMPCAELADSIVQCGRKTLENAISFVNKHDRWNAKVIYGDTDSMFVLLKGRTVKESFEIGHEIASAVTATNPHPVTLKMEKIYHPCFLLTKKRYVGYSYENTEQVKPVFDAKGIETVRRDTCGAVAKIMEQSLRLFFEHKDIDKVKAYMLRQWTRILSGRVSLQDFVFAKEVRLGTYRARTSSSLPPAAIVATKAMRADHRAEPRYAERIPYVVVHGEPGSRLIDMVVDPLDLLAIDSPFRLNDAYYITKQIIPALQRVFGLVGADLSQWFADMPRPGRELIAKRHSYAPNAHRKRIDYYYLSKHCFLCGELVQALAHLCGQCSKNESAVSTAIIGRTSKSEKEIQHLASICRHCGGGDWILESGVKCTSLACSIFYERRKVQKELKALSTVATETGLYPRCMVEWF
ncbi:DNA polymerase zeta catalytic subunit like [Actinidia chinensis var. chinensis]|uniref:DNA polymerase zeta catalytic subunit n=1 Tax=Actinidia chinensis var. chinensis TaxID=1590841 RepID=A0A2R6RAJ3_ACTCC|nr:DNA polymerase zeta catalytic subunit like [Actinidia chinensis var. chinensis]